MIIATFKPFVIGKTYSGKVSTLEKEWTLTTFVVLEAVTEKEMLEQLEDLNYSIEEYKRNCSGNELYYKVLVD